MGKMLLSITNNKNLINLTVVVVSYFHPAWLGLLMMHLARARHQLSLSRLMHPTVPEHAATLPVTAGAAGHCTRTAHL